MESARRLIAVGMVAEKNSVCRRRGTSRRGSVTSGSDAAHGTRQHAKLTQLLCLLKGTDPTERSLRIRVGHLLDRELKPGRPIVAGSVLEPGRIRRNESGDRWPIGIVDARQGGGVIGLQNVDARRQTAHQRRRG